MSELVAGIALIAVVLTLSGLASGLVERAPLSFPMIFLGLGLALGGTGVIELDSHSPILEAVGIISLALVLFLDAVKLQLDELKQDWLTPILSLGPGTLLIIGIVALGAYGLLGIVPLEALLLGTVLASTDPVVLREIIRDERIPRSVRRALGVEAGTNDIVVLPIVLILIAVIGSQAASASDWALFFVRVLIFSPLIGLAVGGFGSRLMGMADRRFGVRSEYQALYGIGLVLLAFVAATAIQGDGFLSAFFAGLAVTLFNVRLCDCFMEYGETTSEMMMLLAFILFGIVLSSLLTTVPLVSGLLFALLVIAVARPAALWLVLGRARISRSARAFIAWFGPRGLNSLLLMLLAVQADLPNAEYLLAITGMVVVVSVVLHGTSATPLAGIYARRVAAAQSTLPEERESTFADMFQDEAREPDLRIPVSEFAQMIANETPPPLVLDVRSRAHYERDEGQIPGSERIPPDLIVEWAGRQDKARTVVAYCTCPEEASAARVARELRHLGFKAYALIGGYEAWRAEYPIEPKGVPVAAP